MDEGAADRLGAARGQGAHRPQEDAIKRDDAAKTATEQPLGDAEVLDDDRAAKQCIDQRAIAVVTAHQRRGDADDAALFHQVERMAGLQVAEGEDGGTA